MARGSLPAVPSRIFTRKRSLGARILRASLAALSLLVALGLGTALYLQRAGNTTIATTTPSSLAAVSVAVNEPPAAPAPATEAPAEPAPTATPTPEPPAPAPAAEAVAEPAALDSPPEAAPPAAGSPAAGSSAISRPPVPSPQVAVLKAPAPALSSPRDTGRYWVEYGVYIGERHARLLQQALAAHSLAASIVTTHTPDGRALVRVRSLALADYAEAREAATRAEHAAAISPLVHRSPDEPPPAAAALPLTSWGSGDQPYWVQFGAFWRAGPAARLQAALQEGGIAAIVATTRAASGRLLFLVRVVQLPDRRSALVLAQRGRQAANVNVLVGRSLEPRRRAATMPSRFAAGDSNGSPAPQRGG